MSAESLEIARRLDAIYDTNLTNDLVLSLSSSPSYTLAELAKLAERWAIEDKILATDRWLVSSLIAWLAKKEREGE